MAYIVWQFKRVSSMCEEDSTDEPKNDNVAEQERPSDMSRREQTSHVEQTENPTAMNDHILEFEVVLIPTIPHLFENFLQIVESLLV